MKYILDSKLMIMVDETPITVTKDNLMNFDDNIDLLDSSIRYMEKELSQITCDMEKIESKFQDDINTLFREDDVVDYALNEISKIPLNYAALKEKKDQMLETKKKLNEKIEMILSYENDIKQDTVNWIKIFEEKLNVDDQLKNRPDLFTSDIKSLSGTVYYKLAFCFKMAYIKIIEEHLNIKLPIVLDSPSGREVTGINVKNVIGILNDYFSDNQIIIASIYSYALDDVNQIKIENSLFDIK
ncbi:hypothetical protein AKUH4B102A_01150 [Apilactobacillus kunkeei]|nr:hypothetical protein AKUH4B102A_01150 [Apilactobacillus kunkeei]